MTYSDLLTVFCDWPDIVVIVPIWMRRMLARYYWKWQHCGCQAEVTGISVYDNADNIRAADFWWRVFRSSRVGDGGRDLKTIQWNHVAIYWRRRRVPAKYRRVREECLRISSGKSARKRRNYASNRASVDSHEEFKERRRSEGGFILSWMGLLKPKKIMRRPKQPSLLHSDSFILVNMGKCILDSLPANLLHLAAWFLHVLINNTQLPARINTDDLGVLILNFLSI